ncbi:putative methyltransferase DDB_G0268948 isoform X2 [Stegodyphus dumicola]|uniref:putative methyltransferase DDB_G0268948 isoform X2 n=1 Tax=Stegodyphus dumicola TaxID=202533 RepID=UPI0015B2B85C|nr:putative methyltransferase DDB_G0268948 isoform X2 [Stegodyphus dumicola]
MFNPPFELAVDVGCGTGQSTLLLAPPFRRVRGFDVSKAQIHEAMTERRADNVEYGLSRGEDLPVKDLSVQLLTAGTCFHWLHSESFFEEAKRVLLPGGVLAIYSSWVIYPVTGHQEKDDFLRQITDKFLYVDLKNYRSEKVQQLFDEYRNIDFPFEEVTRHRNISQKYIGTAADACGYIRSMSTFQNFRSSNPEAAEQLMQNYQNNIMDILGVSSMPEETSLAYQRKYFLILCRKPKYKPNETEP